MRPDSLLLRIDEKTPICRVRQHMKLGDDIHSRRNGILRAPPVREAVHLHYGRPIQLGGDLGRGRPMSNHQAESELALFKLFAESAGLSIVPGSIESRQPPEPDIRCVLTDSGATCFELVEIVDSDLAKAVGIQLKFQKRLETDAATSRIQGLGDALVFVSFSASSTSAQKQQACGALLTVIRQLPEGFRGDIDPTPHAGLTGIVRKLRVTRGEFVGPAFQVDGGAFISDPIIELIQEKFGKTYKTDAPIDLLAYYELHPTQRAEFELPGVREYVVANLPGSHFSRVWVFDAHNRSVLYCS